MRKFISLLLFTLLITGCCKYLKCLDCDASYKAYPGIPGAINMKDCRNCDGRLKPCSKIESGWNEERYQEEGNEIW